MNRIGSADAQLLYSKVSHNIVRVSLNQSPYIRGKAAIVLLLAAFVGASFSSKLGAQSSSSASVVGRVTDTTGAVVTGATVHIVDLSTGLERVVTTDENGSYSAQNLPPDNYSVHVEKSGFQSTTVSNVPLQVGKTATVVISLQVGTATQTIEVTTIGAELQTQDASVGQVMSEKQVNDLPLNGRNMLQLASLTAGVSAEQTTNTGNPAGNGGIGTRNLYVTIDGGRASSTNYVLDGVVVRSIRFNTMSVIPSVDATQEFNVVRGPASTEYGQGTATVTMVTKSGSNKIHGSAFEFTRSEIFDARNYFSTYSLYPRKPVYHRNQYGGSIGLPFIKDRLFGFAGFEQQSSLQSKPAFSNFPTAAQFQAVGINVNNPQTNFPLYNVLLPTFAAQGLFTPTPACVNNPQACGGNNFEYGNNFVDNYTTWTGRMDQTISSKQNMFERYIDYNSKQVTPAPFDVAISPVIGRNVSVGHTYVISSSVVNDLRLGWNHTFMYGVTQSAYTNDSWDRKAGVTNVTGDTLVSEYGRPTITITGFSAMGGDSGLGQGDAQDVYSASDTIGFNKGRHNVRAGIQYSWRQAAQQAELASNGSFTFASLTTFAQGVCSTCQGSNGTSKGHYTDNTYGIFANDIWQIARKLTLNYGMRWEYDSPFVEKNHLVAGFDAKDQQIAFHIVPPSCTSTNTTFCIPTSLSGLGIFNMTPNFFPAGIIKPTKDRFAPRVGLAYQVNSALVVRAGFGMYVDNVNTNELQFIRNITPNYITQVFNNYNISNGIFPSINNYVPNTANGFPAPFTTDPNNRLPYSYQWDFSLQQGLGHQTVMEFAYTGSDSHLLWRRYDKNEDLFSGPAQAPYQVRPYNSFSHGMLTSANIGHGSFEGASIRVEQRPIHGFYYLGVYQFSKNQDDQSGEADANDTSFSNNPAFDRALSNFDQRHRAAISGGYNLPFGQGQRFLTHGIGDAIAGGWTIQPIVAIHSGFPFTISNAGATFGQYAAFRGFLAPGRNTASAKLSHPTASKWYDATAFCSTVTLYGVAPECPKVVAAGNGLPGNGAWQGNVRRNTLLGPKTFQNDLSLIKNFRVHESLSGQFRAEAFNLINKTNLANPNAAETSSNAGTITQTSTDNRDLQFALKFLF